MLAEDRRHDEVVARARSGAFGKDLLDGQAGPDGVLAQDVLDLDRLRRGRDVVGIELGEDRVLVDDVVELALQARQLLLGQAKAGQVATCSTSLRERVATGEG